jgi:flagellar motor switch protein FliN/FliY
MNNELVNPPVGASTAAGDLGQLAGVEVDVSVELGRAKILIGALQRLRPGSIIPLGRPVDEPADLLVNGTKIADAELTCIDGQFAARIASFTSTER